MLHFHDSFFIIFTPSTKVVSLDDILGADLVNKENIVKQPLVKQTSSVYFVKAFSYC